MLFHITHIHSAESCPYHDPETVAKTYGKALLGFEEAGVTLHGAYVDALSPTDSESGFTNILIKN